MQKLLPLALAALLAACGPSPGASPSASASPAAGAAAVTATPAPGASGDAVTGTATLKIRGMAVTIPTAVTVKRVGFPGLFTQQFQYSFGQPYSATGAPTETGLAIALVGKSEVNSGKLTAASTPDNTHVDAGCSWLDPTRNKLVSYSLSTNTTKVISNTFTFGSGHFKGSISAEAFPNLGNVSESPARDPIEVTYDLTMPAY